MTDDEARPIWRTRADQRDEPPPVWLVEGLIQENSDCAIYAPWGALKSFVAIDIAMSIATGQTALGGFKVNKTGPSFYCMGEGYTDATKLRMTAWEIDHGYEPFTAPDIYTMDGIVDTSSATNVQTITDSIVEVLGGRQAGLVIIDTMNRALNGQDEDKAGVASKYLRQIKSIRKRVGGTTITIAHTGKDGSRGGRGSSAFEGGYDTVLLIDGHTEDEKGDHTISIEIHKQKGGRTGKHYYFGTKIVATPDGDTLAMVHLSEDEGIARLKSGKSHTENKQQQSKPSHTPPEMVAQALRQLCPDGSTISGATLHRTIASLNGENSATIKKYLDRKIEDGDEDYKRYKQADGKWGFPQPECPEAGKWLDQLADVEDDTLVVDTIANHAVLAARGVCGVTDDAEWFTNE